MEENKIQETLTEDELLEAIAEGKISGCNAFRTLCMAANAKNTESEKESE